MLVTRDVPLSGLTTLRVGGPAREVVRVGSDSEVVEVMSAADAAGTPVLLLGGGSNLVVADAGFDGTVVQLDLRGVTVTPGDDGGRQVTVAAGEPWDDVVALTVAQRWGGIEALSGIPGSAGATPIQNVGAYGQEVGHTVVRLRAYDRAERRVVRLDAVDCGFAYRHSRFKAEPDHFVILEITLALVPGHRGSVVRYAELARGLGVEVGGRAPLAEVRDAVLALRRAKGMVLDPLDHDTWSTGSFFTNLLVPAAVADSLPGAAPRYPQADGRVKVSAAWLIEDAGFGRGYVVRPGAPAAVSGKHSLALTNRGGASTADVLELARRVREGVRGRFGVELAPEPVLVGCALDDGPAGD